jgi:hypothetical protein
MLSAVVCPLTPRELPAALSNLAFWDTEMAPLTDGEEAGQPRPKLIFSFNGAPDKTLSRPLIEAFDRCEVVKRSFASIEVRFCRLPPEKDVYLRDGEVADAPFGNKAGPNWLFFETMRALKEEAEFVFLMETDCQPVIPGWIRKIQRACDLNEDAWIIGSHYCGVSPLHWSVARHINGNALYNVGDPEFWDFLEDHFWPWLNDYAVKCMPNLAYDCGWETYLNRVEMEYAGSYEWVRARDVLQRFRLSNFVVNIGGAGEQAGEYVWTRADILKRFPGAAVVHGPLATSDDHRRGPLALGRVFLEGAATLDPTGLHMNGDLEGAAFRRSVWIADQPLDESNEVSVSYTIDCPADAGLILQLREPSGRLMETRTKYGAGTGEAKKDNCILAITTPAPYVVLALSVHGPAGSRINVSELSCGVWCNDEPVAWINSVTAD